MKIKNITIYIPLCFYFIQGSRSGYYSADLHLHSTMLLLYLFACRFYKFDFPHLHSTMLLLYLTTFKSSTYLFSIYIPLCFYFISHAALVTGSCFSYLHSTMLLLYLSKVPRQMFAPSTFTFHYASTLSSF